MSIPSWARVGAEVVFVGYPGGVRPQLGEQMPVRGQVYTIRDIEVGPDGLPMIRLIEIVNAPQPYREGFDECWFRLRAFRPLITIEDDLAAHFRALLDVPAPAERERA